MTTNPTDIQQTLLELHYGLLDEAEAAQWRRRIETEPETAVAWAEVLQLATRFAEAAKVRGEPCHLSGVPGPLTTHPQRRRLRIHFQRLASVAALLLVAIVGVRFANRLPSQPTLPIRLHAEAFSDEARPQPNQFQFVTGRGGQRVSVVPANLTWEVRAANAVLHREVTPTDNDGRAKFVVPVNLKLPKDSQLRVTATPFDRSLTATSTTLPLEPTRCLTYLTVDRPLYRPGETVYFRSLTLERHSLRGELDVPVHFELRDPGGAVVPNAVREGVTQRGVGNGAFALPASAAGGQYTLVAKSLDGFFPEEQRQFQVQQYRVPRFKKDIEFKRRSHGPGDLVEADFSASRAEGGPLSKAAVRITATVDGREVSRQQTTTSEVGTCVVSFKLPEHIADGDGQLAVSIDDGGTQETLVKTIPIQLGRVQVDFYPEGGHLVAGLENRVYFAARNPLGKPVHVAGQILDRQGREVARVETVRDGLGSFRFVPRRGERYLLKVTQPVDVTNAPELPAAVSGLPVLDTGRGVFAADEALSFNVRSDDARPVLVQAACRGVSVGEAKFDLRRGDNALSLPIADHVGGVIRLTVLDGLTTPARPLVERLVFRHHEQQLRVKVEGHERSPGDPLRLTLQVTDEHDRPTPAVLGVAVVDDAALSLDEHERPTLRTHFLLTSEIDKPEDLEHANFYLDNQPEAAEAVDLLLGTQGWRRFVEQNLSQPNPDFRAQVAKLLELDGRQAPSAAFDNLPEIEQRLMTYSQKSDAAWSQLLADFRIVAVVILEAWLLSLLFLPRRRRLTTTGLVLWMVVTVSTGLVAGCGGGMPAPTASPRSGPSAARSAEALMKTAPTMDESSAGAAKPESIADAAKTPAEINQSSTASNVSPPVEGQPALKTPAQIVEDANPSSARSSDPSKNTLPARVLTSDDLRRLLAARGLDANSLSEKLLDELRFPVREYAHKHVRRESGLREDFAETLFWQPLLITDAAGQATIRFDLSDSVTTFKVLVDAHNGDGRFGSGGGEVISRLPFQLEPKLPLEVTTGDRIELPVAIINQTGERLPVQLGLSADGLFELIGERSRKLELDAGARQREHFSLIVTHGSAETDAFLEVRGVAGSLTDAVRRKLHVAPSGYPVRESLAGVINGSERLKLKIPNDAVPGSLAVTLRAYPSPLADLLSGVESILREPHGCFEQTTATNYPNTMALQYLQQNQLANPEVTRRAKQFLDRGYQKLTSFECQQRGYEWFGKDPGHEALSAFGLMQFHDMAEVMPVDAVMIERTRTWLLARRNGQGGFQRNPRHLHVWSVQQDVVDAYVLWALTEADAAARKSDTRNSKPIGSDLGIELDHLTVAANAARDPYLIALSAAALLNAGRTADGDRLLQTLTELQATDGSLTGATTVTQSGGLSLTMETTALATIAWLKNPRFADAAGRAAKWIVSNRQGHGGFGSTQATVLALKALVGYAKTASTARQGGMLQVVRDQEVLAQVTLPAGADTGSTMELTGLGSKLLPGETDLELRAPGFGRLSFAMEVLYHAPTPPSDPNCPVRLTVGFASGNADTAPTLNSGDTIRLEASLKNTTERGLPMTVAILGFPAGLEPRAEELNELRETGVFDYYELRPREVVCYWRAINPHAEHRLAITLTAAIPGEYTAPASRTYLYYTAEQRQWTEPLRVRIRP